MTELLAGRTALVTGGTAGIGRGIAEVLTSHGARVAVTGVTEGRCVQAREDGLDVYQLDVRDKKACIRVVNDVAAEFGGLSVLVANAGVYPQARLADLDDDQIDFIFDVNVKGMMHVVQAATPALREFWSRPHRGDLVHHWQYHRTPGMVPLRCYQGGTDGIHPLGRNGTSTRQDHR